MSSRFSTAEVEDSIGCNLIPMIDIMFLLLLFFMLSADMSTREMEDMTLPEADQVKEDDNVRGPDGFSMVNLHHRGGSDGITCPVYVAGKACADADHWLISVRSRELGLEELGPFFYAEGQLELEEATEGGGKPKSKRRVMIRADRLAKYGYVQKILEACASAGIYKIEIAAAKPMP